MGRNHKLAYHFTKNDKLAYHWQPSRRAWQAHAAVAALESATGDC
ncbi:hypothetical protein [Azospirillum doebereinerae]